MPANYFVKWHPQVSKRTVRDICNIQSPVTVMHSVWMKCWPTYQKCRRLNIVTMMPKGGQSTEWISVHPIYCRTHQMVGEPYHAKKVSYDRVTQICLILADTVQIELNKICLILVDTVQLIKQINVNAVEFTVQLIEKLGKPHAKYWTFLVISLWMQRWLLMNWHASSSIASHIAFVSLYSIGDLCLCLSN